MWEIIGYVTLGIMLLLLMLLIVPVDARLIFCEELRLCVRAWGIPVFRYSSEDDTKPTRSSKETPPSPIHSLADRLKTDGVGSTLALVKEFLQLATGAAHRLLAAVTVDKLCLQLYVTGSDAAQTAENTGKVCAVLYPAVTTLQQTVIHIKKREITVTPDFLADTGRVVADVAAHVIPLRVLIVTVWTLFRYRIITKHHKEVSQYGK